MRPAITFFNIQLLNSRVHTYHLVFTIAHYIIEK